ncbi:MAG: MltR family transcriptional regulator [Reyranellaceae bacterium]
MRELSKYPDRIVGIVLGSMMDDRLDTLIRSRCIDETPESEDVFRDVLRDGGPVGAFSTRINVGYLLGLYGKATHRDLVTIKNIRNAFAHARKDLDFNDDRIGDLCRNLKLLERSDAYSAGQEWGRLFSRINPQTPEIPAAAPLTNRQQFEVTCSQLLMIFHIEATNFKPALRKPRY